MPADPPMPPRAQLRYDVVSRILGNIRPATMLEIGCGQGAFGARQARHVEYLGVEPDPDSCRIAAQRIEPLGGTVLNATHEAVPAGRTFDVVCAFEVLEHIDDDAGALKAWTGLIRPGGHFMMSVPAFPKRFGPMDAYVGHFRRYLPEDLRGRLEDAGLVVQDLRVYGWPLGYALEAVRNRIDAKKLARAGEATPAELTAASGRTFQPKSPWTATAVRAATLPFCALQRMRPERGIGLVAAALRPA